MAARSMTQRMVGAAKLDTATYREVEADTTATGQAAGVVALAAVARAIGEAGGGGAYIVGGLAAAFLGWLVWAGITYLIGDKLLGGTATWGEVLRALGFAQAPALLIVLAVIPVLGAPVRFVVAVWVLLAGFIGLREALDLGTGKTLLTVVLGWLALAIPMALLGVGAA